MTLSSSTIKAIQDIMRKDVGVDGDAQRIGQIAWLLFLKIFDDTEQELELLESNYKPVIPKDFRWSAWAVGQKAKTGEELISFVNKMFPALKEIKSKGDNHRAEVVRGVFEDAYNYMKSGTLLRQVIDKINDIDFNSSQDRHTLGDLYEKILKDLQSAGNAGEFYTPRAVTQFMAEMLDPKANEKIMDPACGTGGFLVCAIEHMRNQQYIKTAAQEKKLKDRIIGYEKKQLPHLLCVTNMMIHGLYTPEQVYHDNTLAYSYMTDWTKSDRVDVILTNPPFGGMEEDGIEKNFPAEFRTRETADLFLTLIIRVLKNGGRAAVVLPDGTLFGEGIKTRIKKRLLEECNLHTIVRLPNSVFAPYTSIKTNILFFEKGNPTKKIWYYEHQLPAGQKAYNKTRPMQPAEMATCKKWWGNIETRKGRKETEQAWCVDVKEIIDNNYNLDRKNPHIVEKENLNPDKLLKQYQQQQNEIADLRNQLKNILQQALENENG